MMRSSLLFAVVISGCNGDKDGPDTFSGGDDTSSVECTVEEGLDVYARWVEPVMTDAHPSSCNECHMAGVDLSMVVQDTPCQSMACMEEIGWVDFSNPETSQVLAFIAQDEDVSELVTDVTRQNEYDGFLEWIEWSAECHADVCGEITDPCETATEGNALPEETKTPLGTCTEEALVAEFDAKVYTWKNRCHTCHWVDGEARQNPEAEWDESPAFIDMDHLRGAARTMYNLIGRGNINLSDPAQSMLLTKPLQEDLIRSTSLGDVTGSYHGGGDKFKVTEGVFDQNQATLDDFADWVGTYVACLE